MLGTPVLRNYAILKNKFDKKTLRIELIDPEKQICLELWKYDPYLFTDKEKVDLISMAASLKDNNVEVTEIETEVEYQEKQKYIAITIKQPSLAPFRLILNAYKILLTYMQTNGMNGRYERAIIDCFEKGYPRTCVLSIAKAEGFSRKELMTLNSGY